MIVSILTSVALTLATATLLVTGASAWIYRRLWMRLDPHGRVPTGFGALLALVMLAATLADGASTARIIAFTVIAIASAFYWLDDAWELRARTRLAISFVAGMITGACFFVAAGGDVATVIGGAVASGIVCVVLTNLVNFYDGADLNLAVFIALTATFILVFAPASDQWGLVAFAILAFIAPFAAVNAFPKALYLGDSGSFAFAALFTAMAAAFFAEIGSVPPEAAIPAALPAVDVTFVFLVRIREGHDLLSRNYLHLYQRLNRNYGGFFYLTPQFANAAIVLSVALALQSLGVGRITSVVATMASLTPLVYFLFRHLIAGKPIGPAQSAK